MKKTYKAPKLSRHGSIESMTQQVKTTGSSDGVIFSVPGLTPDGGVPIGS